MSVRFKALRKGSRLTWLRPTKKGIDAVEVEVIKPLDLSTGLVVVRWPMYAMCGDRDYTKLSDAHIDDLYE